MRPLAAIGAYCLVGLLVLLIFYGLGDLFAGFLR